jgi:hypothetical protein
MISDNGYVERPSMLLQHGFPGYIRGVAAAKDGSFICTNSAGQLSRYAPGREAVPVLENLDEAMGVACHPDGRAIVCEAGGGRVLAIDQTGTVTTIAKDLNRPTGVCMTEDGSVIVSEAGAGRVLHIANGDVSIVVDGLSNPQGVTMSGRAIFALDRTTQSLHVVRDGKHEVVAQRLPVGTHSDMKINTLPGIAGLMPGPLSPFSDIATLPDGSVAIGGDEQGSILTVSGT